MQPKSRSAEEHRPGSRATGSILRQDSAGLDGGPIWIPQNSVGALRGFSHGLHQPARLLSVTVPRGVGTDFRALDILLSQAFGLNLDRIHRRVDQAVSRGWAQSLVDTLALVHRTSLLACGLMQAARIPVFDLAVPIHRIRFRA